MNRKTYKTYHQLARLYFNGLWLFPTKERHFKIIREHRNDMRQALAYWDAWQCAPLKHDPINRSMNTRKAILTLNKLQKGAL